MTGFLDKNSTITEHYNLTLLLERIWRETLSSKSILFSELYRVLPSKQFVLRGSSFSSSSVRLLSLTPKEKR